MRSRAIEERIRNRPCTEPSAEATARVLARAAQRPCSRTNRPPERPSRRLRRLPWAVAAAAVLGIAAWMGFSELGPSEPVLRKVVPQAPEVARAPITDAAVAKRLASTKKRLKALKEFDYTLGFPKRSSGETRSTVWTLDQRLKWARSKAAVAAARADWPDDS